MKSFAYLQRHLHQKACRDSPLRALVVWLEQDRGKSAGEPLSTGCALPRLKAGMQQQGLPPPKNERTGDGDVLQRPWTSFCRCEPDPRGPEIQIYRNSRYQVHVRRYLAQDGGPALVHFSIKRLDQRPHIPYRDKMRIKDELLGPEYEGVELLPARSREIDLANQAHLWLIDDASFRFPFGFFDGRLVSDVALEGAVQEPWPAQERPTDCLSEQQVRALVQRASEIPQEDQ